MCVAVSGLVLAINANSALVEIMGNRINADIGLVDVKIGDKVLIHAGCVIQVLNENDAAEIDDIWKLLMETVNEQKN